MLIVKPFDDVIKEYEINPEEEYDQIPFTDIFIMSFGFMYIVDNFSGEDTPLNRRYAVISDDISLFRKDLLKNIEKYYKYDNGEIIRKELE